MIAQSLFPTVDDIALPGPGLERHSEKSWIFRLPRELRSLNATMWGHWRAAKLERERWEAEFAGALAAFEALRNVEGWTGEEHQAFRQLRHQRERRRVRVIRLVPHGRNLLGDDGNLRACDKHLVDAMKRVGLIYDDHRTWLDHRSPTQAIANDRQFWAVVQLDRPDPRAAWR